jgi:hypothetical protein
VTPLEAVFSIGSMPRLYKGSSLASEDSLVRTVELQQSVSYSSESAEAAVRWSPACKDVGPKEDECPPLEAVTEQRD